MITISAIFVAIFTMVLQRAGCLSLDFLDNVMEDDPPQFLELAEQYGQKCVRYTVTTKDGYELGVFNIPGDRNKPVLLQHGFLDSADTFIIRGNGSLAVYLANNGYDVWLGNMRGNKYSRAHERLSPEHLKFWDFSFHEIAIYDMPAMIDFILEKTEQDKLDVIAHSEGTTLIYVMGSVKSEYNKKVNVGICLAPIAYLHNAEKPIFPLVSLTVGPVISRVLSVFDRGELLRNSSVAVTLIRNVCQQELIGYELCAELIAFSVFGRDRNHLEPDFFRMTLDHFPAGSSVRNFMHLQQIVTRRQFAQYDYGYSKNLRRYKSSKPPKYPLNKVRAKIALVAGLNDRLADIKDIQLLRKQLPNVIDYHVMSSKEWNHVDFVWSNDMSELFDHIHNILIKYGN